MPLVRGVAVAPDMGARRCYAVEIIFENDDYALAAMARIMNDDCQHKPVSIQQGSGVCEWHNAQIQERRRSM